MCLRSRVDGKPCQKGGGKADGVREGGEVLKVRAVAFYSADIERGMVIRKRSCNSHLVNNNESDMAKEKKIIF